MASECHHGHLARTCYECFLEQQIGELQAEIERMRAIEIRAQEELLEFKAGWQAAIDGLPPEEPRETPWDNWLVGYAWALWPEEHDELMRLKVEIERLRLFGDEVRGYVADMHRHVKVATEEGTWLPLGVIAIIGNLSQAAKAAEED